MLRSCTTMNGTLPLVITRKARLPVMNCMPRMPCVPMITSSALISEAALPISSYTEPTRNCGLITIRSFSRLARSTSMFSLIRASSRSSWRATMWRRCISAPIRVAMAEPWFIAQSATLVKSVGTRILLVELIRLDVDLGAAKIASNPHHGPGT